MFDNRKSVRHLSPLVDEITAVYKEASWWFDQASWAAKAHDLDLSDECMVEGRVCKAVATRLEQALVKSVTRAA